MPYISESERDALTKLEPLLDQLKAVPDGSVDGVLNYAISRIVAGTLGQRGWRYRKLARALAVFEAAKLEFQRRVVGPYEDGCIARNGDIPEYKSP